MLKDTLDNARADVGCKKGRLAKKQWVTADMINIDERKKEMKGRNI